MEARLYYRSGIETPQRVSKAQLPPETREEYLAAVIN